MEHCGLSEKVISSGMEVSKSVSASSTLKRKVVEHQADDECPGMRCGEHSSECTREVDSKLEAKRAYNRANAARARKRTKEHILELSSKLERLTDTNQAFEQKNRELLNRVSTLSEENKLLRSLLLDVERGPRQLVAPSHGPMMPYLKHGTLAQGLGFATSTLPTNMSTLMRSPLPKNL